VIGLRGCEKHHRAAFRGIDYYVYERVRDFLDHPQFEGFEVRQTVRRGEDTAA
jgi:hypothetical protein